MTQPKVGDIFRWSWNDKTLKKYKHKIDAGTLYWCLSKICIFKEDGRYYDTYWSSITNQNRIFTKKEAEEKLELEYIANINDLVEIDERERAYYNDKDIVDIRHANMIRGGVYLRKGAKKSLSKMKKIMKRNIKKLQNELDILLAQIEDMENRLSKLDIDSRIPIVDRVSVADNDWMDEQ